MSDVPVLWRPPADGGDSRMARFARAVGHDPADYEALWRWSVTDLDGFWAEIWQQFGIRAHSPYQAVLSGGNLPEVRWFPGATLNYAEHALAGSAPGRPAIIARSQTRPEQQLSYAELTDAVTRAAAGLRRLGVRPGDRIAGYLPNCVEAVVGFLACAAIGAVWSSCAPEFGIGAVVDRFAQIEPRVLIAAEGYRYGAKDIDRTDDVRAIAAGLPTLDRLVIVPYLGDGGGLLADQDSPDRLLWRDLVEHAAPVLEFEPVLFDHPLYILYSSGTTGVPKAIVHGHGGILVEHLKMLALHLDIHPGDRFFWFTTTGWMMWNYIVSGLLVDATVVLYDGDPTRPEPDALWALAAELGITHFGVSAGYLMNCREQELRPGERFDLSRLRHVGSTGSPLPAEGYDWVYDHVGKDLILGSASGGSDVCSAFVASAPLVPVYRGEISCRCLGAAVAAYDSTGHPVVEQLGELVVAAPMPSMPVGMWGDVSGEQLRKSYFDLFPGVWRHGDWITITSRGSCVISGRSDATLNRGGVRMGTAEFYRVVEQLPEVADSLVVHHDAGGADQLYLFVALRPGQELTVELRGRITGTIRSKLSPRYVPDVIAAVDALPRTLTGKKLEVPVKRILAGEPPAQVASADALTDPTSLDRLVAGLMELPSSRATWLA